MGTNYYRIPPAAEMDQRKEILIRRLKGMAMNPNVIERKFCYIDSSDSDWAILSPWDEFTEGTRIHLGKRSGGWKFLWNFHNDKYYKNKEELLSFIRSGRVVDEYGKEHDADDFITMAMEWGQPNAWDTQTYYQEHPFHSPFDITRYYDRYIDGLRISPSVEFS